MFGMGLPEIITIALVAVVVLGPDKLPEAMVNIAKFFKSFKQTVNSAKSTFEQEIKIAQLKEDAKKYKENLLNTTSNVRKKITLEELDDLKNTIKDTKDSATESFFEIKNDLIRLGDLTNAKISFDESNIKPKQLATENTMQTKTSEILDTQKQTTKSSYEASKEA